MKLRTLWWFLGTLMLAYVLYVCLVPLQFPSSMPYYNDKVMHVVAFVGLAVWFGGLLAANLKSRIALGGALLSFGVLIEFLQSYTAYRSAELGDVVADGSGVLLGLLLLQLGLCHWPLFVETRIFRLKSR